MKNHKPQLTVHTLAALALAACLPALVHAQAQPQPATNIGQILSKQERLLNLDLDEKLARKTSEIAKITNPAAPTAGTPSWSAAPAISASVALASAKPVQQKRDLSGEFVTHAVYGTDGNLTLEYSYLGQRLTSRRGETQIGWRLVSLTGQNARFMRTEADTTKPPIKIGQIVDVPVRLVAVDTATMRTLLAPATPNSGPFTGPLPSGVPTVQPSMQTPQAVGQFAMPGLPPTVGLPQGATGQPGQPLPAGLPQGLVSPK